jgi:hypothetical protein
LPLSDLAVRVIGALLLIASIGTGCTSTATTEAGRTRAAETSCAPVFFGVPGSAEGVENAPPRAIPAGVSRTDARRYGTTVGLLKTTLTAIAGRRLASARAIDYPAAPLSPALGPVELLAVLAASERTGAAAAVTAIRHAYRGGRCAARPVLLAGYSQGAEVVIQAVNRLTAAEQAHVAVALFGNPSYLPDEPGDFPGHTGAAGVRPSLHGKAFRLPAGVRQRTIDVCAPGDGVCGVAPGRRSAFGRLTYVLSHAEQHSRAYAFEHNGYVRHAARFLWAHR